MTNVPDSTPRILWSSPDHWAEQDCACADEDFASVSRGSTTYLTARDLQDAEWQITPGVYSRRLTAHHILHVNPSSDAGVAVLNHPAQDVLDAFAAPKSIDQVVTAFSQSERPLVYDTCVSLARLKLLQKQFAAAMPPYKPTTLTAWLHVTNACNLRCSYCYLGKTDEAMDEETGRAAVDAIFRSAVQHRFDAVKLKYAGGEATLNFRLVQRLHAYANALAQDYGLRLQEVVLSNGVALSHAMLDFIRESNMRLMISLDGVGQAHDAQRAFANGRGSAHLVKRSIQRALSRGVEPYLSITVTGHNAATLTDTITFALDHDLLFNLNFYRDNDYAADHDALITEDARLIAGVQAAFKVIEERLPRHNLIAALLDRANFGTPHDRACGAGHNYMVIDHNGRIARCHMEIERTITDVRVEDPLAFIQAHDIGFRNVSVDNKEGCRDCTWRQWCAGGCPLLTYRVTGRSDVQSPYCNVYRALYPEVVRLEGLRLLMWEAQAA
ncbi:MAG: radical SAM protein [Anaerolineae bacterium]